MDFTKRQKILLYAITGTVLALILYLFDRKLIHLYMSLPFLSGSDGSGHWSIGEYYSAHIFPKTWGWIPVWSGGMPFPQFYPPFFFFFNALVAHIFPWVEYLTISKLLVVGSAFLIPITVVWTAKQLFRARRVGEENTTHSNWSTYIPAILAGVLSVFVVTTVGGQSSLGFTLQAAINKGFVPQFFALIPILLCLGFVSHIHTSRFARYASGLFFFIALLTNVHTALLLVVVIGSIALTEMCFSGNLRTAYHILKRYALVFGIAGFSASFWFFPLFATYSYLTSVPLTFEWDRIDQSLISIFLISFPIATYLSIRRKNPVVLGIIVGISIIAVASILRMDQKFPYLPFHMYRWLAITPYVCMILIAYIPDSFNFRQKRSQIFFSILLILGAAYIYRNEIRIYTNGGIYLRYMSERVDDLISYIQKNPGLTTIGTDEDLGRNASFIIDAKLGLLGVPTTTHIIRESAPSGLFLAPTRNTFSSVFEMAGVRTYIGKTENFTRQPIELRINRARGLGIRYIVASDPGVVGALSTSTGATFIQKFGPRYLYEIQDYTPKTSALEVLPTLAFSPLNFKVRPAEELNFTMLGEQALMQNAFPYVYIARDPDRNIDEIPLDELKHFSSIIFTTYPYKNIDTALSQIQEYTKDRIVYAVEQKSPLFLALQKESLNNKNIIVYKRNIKEKNIRKLSENIVGEIFRSIQKNGVPSNQTNVVPYYIRQTYYPWWNRVDDKMIYAVTPFYTLTFGDKGSSTSTIESTLVFKTGRSVHIGLGVTLALLLGMIYVEVRRLYLQKN
ncbi:MAG: hypothetical protein FGM57_03130 [Candidatus Taylorbacteria bacterium]|nr:hypothetical protein [Candidatus Taylorbacteria bacterium]